MSHNRGRAPGVAPDGPKIRRLRSDLGLTAAQLAARTGSHPKTIMLAETETRRISRVLAGRIAMALSVKVSDILTDDDEDERVLAS